MRMRMSENLRTIASVECVGLGGVGGGEYERNERPPYPESTSTSPRNESKQINLTKIGT